MNIKDIPIICDTYETYHLIKEDYKAICYENDTDVIHFSRIKRKSRAALGIQKSKGNTIYLMNHSIPALAMLGSLIESKEIIPKLVIITIQFNEETQELKDMFDQLDVEVIYGDDCIQILEYLCGEDENEEDY